MLTKRDSALEEISELEFKPGQTLLIYHISIYHTRLLCLLIVHLTSLLIHLFLMSCIHSHTHIPSLNADENSRVNDIICRSHPAIGLLIDWRGWLHRHTRRVTWVAHKDIWHTIYTASIRKGSWQEADNNQVFKGKVYFEKVDNLGTFNSGKKKCTMFQI